MPSSTTPDALAPTPRWLLLVLQLPARPSNARVKTWRRLQQLGAVPVKNAVYALPHSSQALEDFAWLRAEIQGFNGQAAVFAASSVDEVDDMDIIEQFRSARGADFKRLVTDVRRARAAVRSTRERSAGLNKEVRDLRLRLEAISAIDFFDAPHRTDAQDAVADLESAARPTPRTTASQSLPERVDRRLYRRRTWVTRPRPGVDRFASAWLIQVFIDPQARFAFASEPSALKDSVPFDMYDAGFRHEGQRCTFEVLQLRFGIDDPTVRRIGEIVHDIDLKEDAYHAPQVPTVAALVEGLRASYVNDDELLRQGMALFQALYEGLKTLPARARTSPRKTRR